MSDGRGSMTPVARVVHRTFHSLKTRNFRLFFIGQVISVTGTWINATASAWLVLHLSDSGVALGINTALLFLPILVVGAFGGMMADRLDKRKILIGTQIAYTVVALTLFAIVATGVVQLWMVYGLSFTAGLVTALDNPTRQSFYMEMVEASDVTNAVSLNSAVFMASRIVGASLAGALIASFGTAICYLVDGLSYVAVIVALVAMRPADLHGREQTEREHGNVRDGFRYVWDTPALRRPLILMAIVFTFAFNWSVLIPLLAKHTFGGTAAAFGVMSAFSGVGALLAALVMANRNGSMTSAPTLRLLAMWALASGAALLLTAVSPTLAFADLTMVPLGFTVMIFIITANSMLQLSSKPEYRGRVMALYGMVFLGSTPIGAVMIGWLAQRSGPRAGFLVGGLVAIGAGLGALWLRSRAAAGASEAIPITDDVVELSA